MKNPLPIAILASLLAPAAQAATYTVTTLADSGAGSLRAAVAAANAASGADAIVFQSGLAGTITLTGGELLVTDNLSITGPGPGRITLDANHAGRAFHLTNPNGQDKVFAISGLTVTHGATSAAGGDDGGGGVFYEASSIHAQITLADMVFSDNTAARKGGAVSVDGANLILRNVSMTGNAVAGGFQPSGGALYFSRGLVTIEKSRIVGNSAELNAGGMRLASPGVDAVITDTLVQDNTATHTGGAMVADTMHSLRISRSAFVGNSTGQPYGGGIYFAGVTDAGSPENVIENSTFSANVSRHDAGTGSALAIWQGNMTVRNSTFAFNRTSPELAPIAGAGGAVWLGNGASTKLKLQSVLFAGNTHGNGGLKVDLTRNDGGSVQSTLDASYSSFQAAPAIGVISGTNDHNLFDVDPLLQPLAFVGGPTPVHPLPPESEAIDAGSNPASLATDQRGSGHPRAADAAHCGRPGQPDIGAFEYYSDWIFCNGFND